MYVKLKIESRGQPSAIAKIPAMKSLPHWHPSPDTYGAILDETPDIWLLPLTCPSPQHCFHLANESAGGGFLSVSPSM